jgi:hypothetical protein
LAALDRLTARTGHVRCFGSLLSFDHIEFDFFFVAQTSQILVRVVLGDCRLMYENILVGVQTIDETVSVLDVEPFDLAFHAGGEDFLLHLFFALVRSGVLIFLSFGHFSLSIGFIDESI